jgi:ribosomal subunit interface protein
MQAKRIMEIPLQITFSNLPWSEAVEASIRGHVAKLDRYHQHIMSCRVVVEVQHKHHQHGNHYHVRIEVKVPGAVLVASRQPGTHHRYTDRNVAIRDAFDAIRRQLEDHVRKECSHANRQRAQDGAPHGRMACAFSRWRKAGCSAKAWLQRWWARPLGLDWPNFGEMAEG